MGPVMKVSRGDIEMAFDFVSSARPEEHTAVLDKSTGTIYYHSEFGDLDEIPDDLWESKDAVEIPHKNEFDLGKQLVLRFVGSRLPDDHAAVEEIFRRRGACGRYKDLLASRRLLDEWYEFEKQAMDKAIQEWCEAHGIELSE
jgi:hypothetical protein